MLASKTKSVSRYGSGNTGLKFSKTLSAIERVSRVFRSHEYSPAQRNVFPFIRCTPSVSILRDFQNWNSDSGKSSPTMPTNRTGEKKLAPRAAYEADPPNKSECSSTGVLTVSIAIEPTTRTDMIRMSKHECRMSNKARKAEHSCQHVGGAARVINNAVRLQQSRNHHNALCTRVDHTLQIVDVDPANAEDRGPDFCVDPPDVCEADRRIVRFCGRGEDWAESDVVRAFALRCQRLLQAVRGFSD